MKHYGRDSVRKICVVLVDRANYGRLKPVMVGIHDHPEMHLQVVAAGTLLLERFDLPINQVRRDGFSIDGQVFMELEGSIPATMAKSVGYGVIEFTSEFQRLKPDFVLVIGDRYEALAAVIAASFMNICIVHIQGGEVSGSIDESTRHAISKFAHFHFPSTKRAGEYLVRMGEDPSTVFNYGCPSGDLARELDRRLPSHLVNEHGSGPMLDMSEPFALVVFHPTTTEYGGEAQQMEALLDALNRLAIQTVLLWPNIDAGSDHVSKAIRRFRVEKDPGWLRTLINLPPEDYLKLLSNAACAIGNSSSFVRDGSYFGTPVVLVGNRQNGREMDEHVTKVNPESFEIVDAVKKQIEHGRYGTSHVYGDGYSSEKIVDKLAQLKPYVQKRLYFVKED